MEQFNGHVPTVSVYNNINRESARSIIWLLDVNDSRKFHWIFWHIQIKTGQYISDFDEFGWLCRIFCNCSQRGMHNGFRRCDKWSANCVCIIVWWCNVYANKMLELTKWTHPNRNTFSWSKMFWMQYAVVLRQHPYFCPVSIWKHPIEPELVEGCVEWIYD